MRESRLEKRIKEYAEKHGILTWKLSSPGNSSVPDRLFIFDGVTHYGEIKRPGGKPSEAQLHRLDQLFEVGAPAFWVDNWEDAKQYIDFLILKL